MDSDALLLLMLVRGLCQSDLARLAGVSRQRANQGLKVLEDAGLVKSEYGGIHVLDLDGLRTFGD